MSQVPLCVDLDGTLTPVDTLHESILSLVKAAPLSLFMLPLWATQGKAHLKREVARRARLNFATLPLNLELERWLTSEHSSGRQLILVTAADSSIADAIATRAGFFAAVLASDGIQNLSGKKKLETLVNRYGERGFDYVGNARIDETIWAYSRKAIVVGTAAFAERVGRMADVERTFEHREPSFLVWAKALRLHQWSKNILILLPALLAHKIFEPVVLIDSILAFFSFSLCASSIYVVNDLLDLPSDRAHPRKRRRAFATGRLTAKGGLVASMAIFALSLTLAFLARPAFEVVLGGYYVLTWAYSLRLKRAPLVDVMTLAGLYTVRIIAGSAATSIPLSFWLLAFSVFMFLSLGIVKRYAEVNDAIQSGKGTLPGRGYGARDLPLLLNLGVASGYCTIVVMALYINSTASSALYQHNKPLWLACPLLLYWISRIWLLTTRGEMPDDPVVFALKDRISLYVIAILALIVLLSI